MDVGNGGGGETMKRFLIEIDDESWEDMLNEQREAYGNSVVIPPVDEDVFYDYLCRRMDADIEWPEDAFVGVRITDVTNS